MRGLSLASICILLVGLPAFGQPPTFTIPKTNAEWSEQSRLWLSDIHMLTGHFKSASGLPRLICKTSSETRDGVLIERREYSYDPPKPRLDRAIRAIFIRKSDAKTPLPLVILELDGKDAPLAPGLDGLLPGIEVAKRGMAALWIEHNEDRSEPVRQEWMRHLTESSTVLNAVLLQKEVDVKRVAIFGHGGGATRAAWLMGSNSAINNAVFVGGMRRLADITSPRVLNSQEGLMSGMRGTDSQPGRGINAPVGAAKGSREAVGGGMGMIDPMSRGNSLDTDVFLALCGGRRVEWAVGDRDPLSPEPSIKALSAVGNAMKKLLPEGYFHVTMLARQDRHYDRLRWMAALEIFDKAFFEQFSTPLGHAPEPEPEITSDFVDLAAHSLAGWVPEMSQRPGSWILKDGVIICNPGPEEYGWLRAPIEVTDFILSVEWRVPKKGNSGIFLRAKPVPWFFPPSKENKWTVGTFGLDWPSRTGLELQAQDDRGESNKYTSGSLYRHAGTSENTTKPVCEWNRFTVRARGPRIEVWSNGTQVLDANLNDCGLTLANPPLKGYIGLQNHGGPGDYRRVLLKRL
jgi:hypothetical protein